VIKEAIETAVNGRSLTFEQAASIMEEIMIGEATPAQVAALVTALRIKGETVDEIAGLATVMRAKTIPVEVTSPVAAAAALMSWRRLG
jgi:anthranilate phosphoribosyltransferase